MQFTQVHAFNTLFRLGVQAVCDSAHVVDPREAILRYIELKPTQFEHTPIDSTDADSDCYNGTINSELGVDDDSWARLLELARQNEGRVTLIQPSEVKLRAVVVEVLRRNPALIQRFADIARTIEPQCGGVEGPPRLLLINGEKEAVVNDDDEQQARNAQLIGE